MKPLDEMTDLELVNHFCDTSLRFIHPVIFRMIEQRGLYHIVNLLPSDSSEAAKAVAYARMVAQRLVFGDDQIDRIASTVRSLDMLRQNISTCSSTDVHKLIPLLEEALEKAKSIYV